MPQIDVKLTTSADLSGINAARSGVQQLEQAANRAGGQWDHLTKQLGQKFSASDIGKQVLSGIGLGSGFAVAETFSRMIVGHFEAMANAAKQIETYTARSLKATQEMMNMRKTPQQQIDDARKELDRLEKRKAELEKPRYQTYKTGGTVHGEREERTHTVQVKLSADEQGELSELPAKINEADLAVKKLEKSFSQSADSMRASVNETSKLNQEIKKVRDLVGPNGLTQAEADQMIDKLRVDATIAEAEKLIRIAREERQLAGPTWAEANIVTPEQEAAAQAAADAAILAMNEDAAKDAIRAAREEVEKYDVALSLLDHNPALNDQEKYRSRVNVLDQQTAAIQRLKKQLEDFASSHPEVDVASLTGEIDRLAKQAAENEGRRQAPQTLTQRDAGEVRSLTDPSKHFQSAADGFAGTLMQQYAQIGTLGIRSPARSYRSGIRYGLRSGPRSPTACLPQAPRRSESTASPNRSEFRSSEPRLRWSPTGFTSTRFWRRSVNSSTCRTSPRRLLLKEQRPPSRLPAQAPASFSR